jgi:hypothetical protein
VAADFVAESRHVAFHLLDFLPSQAVSRGVDRDHVVESAPDLRARCRERDGR